MKDTIKVKVDHQPIPKATTVLEEQANGEFSSRIEPADLRQKYTQAAALWVPTAALAVWADNPRVNDHAVPELMKVIKRFGFGSPIVALPNGEIIAGHTRLKAALELRLVEVPVRFMDLDRDEAHLMALADNRVGEIAEWSEDLLADVLLDMETKGVDITGIGWDEGELASIMAKNDPLSGDAAYTTKIEAPIYEIKGERPDETDLVDKTTTLQLRAQIEEADIEPKVRAFLLAAAARHTVFSYDKIAEYYAHAPAEIQKLMEDSALVIIDFERAIELGFVKLTKDIAEAYTADHG